MRSAWSHNGSCQFGVGASKVESIMSVLTSRSWPPDITTEQLEQLTLLATTYALSHSLIYLPLVSPDKPLPSAPESVIHAPISLIPAPIPRHLFSRALTLQRAYNTLYARVALDTSFLDHLMGPGGVSDVDDFTSALWSAWKKLRNEGVPTVCKSFFPFCYVLMNRLFSLSTLVSFDLTTCYTNQLLMIRSLSNKWNSIPSPRLSALSLSESQECIGVWPWPCPYFGAPFE